MDTEHQQAALTADIRLLGQRAATPSKPRSLLVAKWPASHRLGWAQACLPTRGLRAAGQQADPLPVGQADIARRYGLYSCRG